MTPSIKINSVSNYYSSSPKSVVDEGNQSNLSELKLSEQVQDINLIYKLESNQLQTPRLNEVGGKAKSLIESLQAGFNVPPGLVLTTHFFEPWLEQVKNSDEWQTFLKTNDKSSLSNSCDRITALCSKLNFSDLNEQKLLNNLHQVFSFNQETKNPLSVAVRSSSPEEDLEEKSFAGNYVTKLGVPIGNVTSNTGPALYEITNLTQALKDCFASLFDERVVLYKEQVGIDITTPGIAVIIQQQIASDVSGVAFSINPQNNCYDEVVINSNFGLGESVVSGDVTPDSYVVDKVKCTILNKKIARKSHGLVLNACVSNHGNVLRSANEYQDNSGSPIYTEIGGVKEKKLQNCNESSLADNLVLEVADLNNKVESWYKKPMDIEWAIKDDTIYLLQARPITTHFPMHPELLTKPGEKKKLYVDACISQGFNETMSLLGADVFTRVVIASKEDFGLCGGIDNGIGFHLRGKSFINIHNMLKMFSPGFVVGQISQGGDGNIGRALSSLDLEAEYIPDTLTKKLSAQRWPMLKSILKSIPIVAKGYFFPERAIEDFKDTIKHVENILRQETAENATFSEVLEEGNSLMKILFLKAILLSVPILTNRKLAELFKGQNVDDLVSAINMNLTGNPTSEMGQQMYELAQFSEIQETSCEETFLEMIRKRMCTDKFLKKYDEYIERFGCRGTKEIDVGAPRQREELGLLYRQLRAMVLENNPIASMEHRKREAQKKLLEISKKMGKESTFLFYSRIISTMMGYREQPKFMWVLLFDKLRKHALKLGEKLERDNRLLHKDQIFDLEVNDIAEVESNPRFNVLERIKKNREALEATKNVKIWPSIFDSRGKIFRVPLERRDDCIFGDPISSGIVRGKAKILNLPDEKPVSKGEIIVTRATNPGWTPIFINAAGVVMEIGGQLNHGAIIAREYGLPCVSGVDGITDLIRDGQMLEVDGSHGIIRILD